MSDINNELVKRLAELSRLEADEAQLELFKKQISAIFTHIDHLKSVDTEGVEPTIQIGGLKNVAREDKVDGNLLGKDQLLNAQKNDGESIIVPRVL